MGSIEEGVAVAEERVDGVEDTVYVAVGKNVGKSQQLLHWVAQNLSGKNICLLHIHQLEPVNSLKDRNLSVYEPKEHAIKAFKECGSQTVHELLDQYILTLVPAGVQAYKLLIEKEDIEKGIIEAISQHSIKWLVMGATADKYKLGKLAEQVSEKSILVREQALLSCNILFISKGSLICSRVDCTHKSEIETVPALLVLNSNMEAKQAEKIKSESIPDALKYLDSDNMEEIESVSSHCSLTAEWFFNSVIGRSKLTNFLFHEEEENEREQASKINGRMEKTLMDAKSMKWIGIGEALKRWKVENSNMEVESFYRFCIFLK